MTSTSSLVTQQPEKFAAIEGNLNQSSYAPELIGGIVGPNGTLEDYIKIPDLQSILATGKASGVTPGLNEFPSDTQPPLFIHILFDFMVIGGIIIFAALAWILFLHFRKKNPLERKYILWILGICGVLAVIILEAGWVLAEVGRQPWIIYNVMKVSQAGNPSNSIIPTAIAIALFYIIIIPLSIFFTKLIFKKNPLLKELKK
jgi:cytochrome d ubiquinol oxidase subunit I